MLCELQYLISASPALTRDWQQRRGKREPEWTADSQAAEDDSIAKVVEGSFELRGQNTLPNRSRPEFTLEGESWK